MSAHPEGRPPAGEPADAAQAAGEPARVTDPREPPRATAREAALLVGGETVGAALAAAFAFDPSRAGAISALAGLGCFYLVAAVVTALWLRRRGELRAAFRPAHGDLTAGAVLAALLYGAAMGAALLVAPRASAREAWLMRLYLQLGDPAVDDRVLVGGVVFVIAALEEVVWRGLVMRALEGSAGRGRAWVLSSALYAAAHLPAVALLADPTGGPNPLLPAAAFGCGMVWARVVHRTGRLTPAIFAHAIFSWAIVSFPVWRP